jgi:hypothetical protein
VISSVHLCVLMLFLASRICFMSYTFHLASFDRRNALTRKAFVFIAGHDTPISALK